MQVGSVLLQMGLSAKRLPKARRDISVPSQQAVLQPTPLTGEKG